MTPSQRALVASLAGRLAAIPGVRAVVLGGSHARGRALPDSDIDLGILYADADPFPLDAVRALAVAVDDGPEPVVAEPYAWGAWVNGGAWLTVGGQRVDFLYRAVERWEETIDDAEAGRYAIDVAQQPPFGFFGPTHLGEIAVCVPLHDPHGEIARLKRRVAVYPEALRDAVVREQLWSADFGLAGFAPKFAARGDVYGVAGCLTRAAHQLVLVLFALNRSYPLNDKTALAEVADFDRAPRDFGERVRGVLAAPGDSAAALTDAVARLRALVDETAALTEGLYQPRYRLSG